MAFMLETAPVAVLRVSFEGRLMNISPQFREITGFNNEVKKVNLFEILSDEYRDVFIEFFHQATVEDDTRIRSCLTELVNADSSKQKVGISLRRCMAIRLETNALEPVFLMSVMPFE